MKVGVSFASLLALIATAGAAVVLARHTDPEAVAPPRSIVVGTDLPVLAGSAPVVHAAGWLNSEPLGRDALQGKVVLYDFWTFGCINCQHTLPYVKAWYERYAADGLIVLSVHTPEFDYEADPDNVASYVADNAIEYPVALDPHRDVWRAFGNHYWPAFYVHDRSGARRYVHFGEGRYQETEEVLRALLGVDPSSPRAQVPA